MNHVETLSPASLQIFRAAEIEEPDEELEKLLAQKAASLRQVIRKRWDQMQPRPAGWVEADAMEGALTKLALRILRAETGAVRTDWARSRLVWKKKTKRSTRAVVKGVGRLFTERDEMGKVLEETRQELSEARGLPWQFLNAAHELGVVELEFTPSRSEHPQVRFSHPVFIYVFGALKHLTPDSLGASWHLEGSSEDKRHLRLAKLALFSWGELGTGLQSVAEADLDVAADFALYVPEAKQRRGATVVEMFFERVELESWEENLEDLWTALEPFERVAARAARRWLLREKAAPAYPIALKVLENFGSAEDLDLLESVRARTDDLGESRLTDLRRKLSSAQENLADESTIQKHKLLQVGKKAGMVALKVGAGYLGARTTPGYGAKSALDKATMTKTNMPKGAVPVSSDFLERQEKYRTWLLTLPEEIETLERQLERLRARTRGMAAQAAEAIRLRTPALPPGE